MQTFFTQATSKDRWTYIAKGRKKHPFGHRLGLSNSTINALFTEKWDASWDSLRVAMLAENVNPRWLAEGLGAPYLASSSPNSDIFNATLSEFLSDESWNAVLATDKSTAAVVLHQPGTYMYSKQDVPYTIVEIVVGPLSRKIISPLLPLISSGRLKTASLQTDQIQAMATGWIGTFDLFGDEKHQGLFENTRLLSAADLQAMLGGLDPEHDANLIRLDLMRAIIALVETTELEEGLTLTPEQKGRIVAAAYRHAQRLGLEPGQIDQAQILPLIEMA